MKVIKKKGYQDIFLIFVSLALGILIWLLVVGADQMDITLKVPVEILNLPKQLVIYNQYQKDVEVTLRGPRTIMQEMRSRNLSLPVDLSQATPDTVVISTDSLPLQLPSGISVLRIQPASITLSVDMLVQRHIPVEAQLKGKIPLGYTLKDLTLTPDKILVSGPQSLLEEQETLKTVPIDMEGRTRSETIPVNLDLSSELMSLIGETTVAAKITMQEKFVEKIIYNIPVKATNTDKPVLLKPDTVSVFASLPERLTVDPHALSLLFLASVQVSDEMSLPQTLPLEVTSVPVSGHEPIVIKSYTPQEVTVLTALPDTKPQKKSKTTLIRPESKKEERTKKTR